LFSDKQRDHEMRIEICKSGPFLPPAGDVGYLLHIGNTLFYSQTHQHYYTAFLVIHLISVGIVCIGYVSKMAFSLIFFQLNFKKYNFHTLIVY